MALFPLDWDLQGAAMSPLFLFLCRRHLFLNSLLPSDFKFGISSLLNRLYFPLLNRRRQLPEFRLTPHPRSERTSESALPVCRERSPTDPASSQSACSRGRWRVRPPSRQLSSRPISVLYFGLSHQPPTPARADCALCVSTDCSSRCAASQRLGQDPRCARLHSRVMRFSRPPHRDSAAWSGGLWPQHAVHRLPARGSRATSSYIRFTQR